jgi:DNA/RNA-binding domain of Phe-tRNA-synthetase-like protein
MITDEPEVVAGFVEQALAAEFPELGIAYTVVDAAARRSPAEVRARLRYASDRFTGGKAIALRQQPIPWAYRVFFRHIGMDPDEQRTPIEALAVERMRAGGFASRGLVEDAVLLATLETGVPVQAFDAAAVEGRLGLRLSRDGESLGEYRPVASGRVVVADEHRPLALLFGDVAADCAVGRTTRRVVVTAVRVRGVPPVSVEEALWTAFDTLTATGE